jgi:hypothetical protein
MINESPLWWLAIPASLGIGWFFLWVFIHTVVAGRIRGEGGETYQNLQARLSTEQIARRDQRLSILEDIGGPECPDGTFSPRQQALWREYHRLEKIDKKLIISERWQLVDAQTKIPDEVWDEIEVGTYGRKK